MRDYLLIYVNGRRHEVRGERVFQSLSDFLRYDLHLTGTKIVCAEGDCGSCSVFTGTVEQGQIRYRTVTSCIQFLFQLDCTHIVSVEGLAYDGELNPIQESMVRCHGAQCGFCTPGFIVSMHAMFETAARPTAGDVRAACVGNLCRCTGYEPIIRAACEADHQRMRPLNELYPPARMLADVEQHQRDEVLIATARQRWFKPTTIESATRFKSQNPQALIFSGGTDLGVQINKGTRDVSTVMSLCGLPDLAAITRDSETLIVGATASITDLMNSCSDAMPEYARLLYWFGSPPIRNAGTLGGNIANGSPIGDTMPALYVLNAEIELSGISGSRRVNINDFYTGYRRTIMQGDELITRTFIPLPRDGEIFKLYKISRRKDLDISALTAAIWLRMNGPTVADARLAFGGVGPNIIRMREVERFLVGQRLELSVLREAGRIARGEITPISDVRGSADYRLQLAENVFSKLYFDLNGRDESSDNGWPVPDDPSVTPGRPLVQVNS